MSLQLVLAGLYSPTDDQVWNDHLKWSPMPYFYTPHELDILLRSFDRPEYLKIMVETHRSKEFQKKIGTFSKFLETLGQITGINFENNFLCILMISGLIFSNEHMGLPLPDWYTPDVKRTFREIRQCFFDGYALTTDMKKFGTGPIIKTFVENMNLDENKLNPRKIYLYSAHDDNVASFVRAHEIRDFAYPEFGCSLIFEKWRDANNKVVIKSLGWTPNDKHTTLRLGGHDEFCPIDDYLKIVQPVIPTDDELDDFFHDARYKDLKKVLFDDSTIKELH
ncbi:testicular acid phosphatase homolog isoform X2 [Phymastichus coffea]|nr:testicular acid phosphatase homolog isoform X2 [Phymastichus coffea]XP_058795127.1 testicular acid phosphatase homolog isoform X2 [Phymastichus coffea]XP_058795128.1 testicular acid phosphatase homolog isoform X2 [Phymastichus coffea]